MYRNMLRIPILLLYTFLTLQSITALANNSSKKLNSGSRQQPDTTVTGRITDSTGNPLPGASILVKGREGGTTTDAQGNFTLYNLAPRSTLIISSVGYVTKEYRVPAGATRISVALSADPGTLTDVIITGFQRIDKSKFTGAAVKLDMDRIKNAGQNDISRMLEGRAAGVAIQNVSGTFGAAPKVRIRGATSITGDNKPLWVIDGVVLEDIVNISNDQLASGDPNTMLGSAVAGLNPNDIETFDILKDAAATALYGARAMNGVIVITTKRGKSGTTSIEYRANVGVQLKPTYRDYDIMNSADQISVYAELERKGYLDYNSISNRANAGIYGRMADLLKELDPNSQQFKLLNTPEARRDFLMQYAGANTNWFDVLFRNALSQEHSLSFSHGSDRAQSYFSTSYYNDQGWSIADKVRRYTINIRNTYNLSDKFTAGFKVQGAVRQQQAPGTISRVTNVVSGSYDRDFDINPFSYALNTSRVLTAYDDNGELAYFRRNYTDFNIINEVRNNYIKLNLMDLGLTGDLQYKFTPWLTYNFIGAIRYVKSTQEHQITENSNQANAFRAAPNSTIAEANKFLYRDPDDPEAPPIVVLPYGGFYNRNEDELKNYTIRNTLNMNKTFLDVHEVRGLIGQEIKYADRQNANNTGFGYQYENGGVPFVDFRIVKQFVENSLQYYGMGNEYERFVGYFGNVGYTYNKRYTIDATIRRDGSNRLGRSEKARWLNSWTVAGRWNVDQEDFLSNVNAISYLTLRASYGLNANYGAATNSLAVLRTQLTNRPYLEDRQLAIDIQDLENAELTWEKKYEANVGIDLGLFQNRFTLSVDGYYRKSLDLISLIRTSGIGGQGLKAANYADLESKGIEFGIGGVPFAQKDMRWETNLIFSYNTNKITRAENFPIVFDLIIPEGGAKVGYPVRGLFSIPFAGLNQVGIPTFADDKGGVSTNVYLQSDETDFLRYEGPVDPTITGGFTNTFSYKNLSLSVHLSYQAGNKIRLQPSFRSEYSDLDALPNVFKNRWVLPGDEEVTNIPAIADRYYAFALNSSQSYPYNYYNYSDARVVDGSFVRLKTVTLNYSLPSNVFGKLPVKTMTVSVVGNNLALLYADPDLHGQDPEFFNAGGIAQPLSKQVTLSLRVGF
ncbi:MAG: SusC/RagA family TonB-linked outer membrane protein [Chitinophagaceae bacterium]|nr:SusC/RagA family TonB-linked outer membrane protein [Chitinophagaceae bacterium]